MPKNALVKKEFINKELNLKVRAIENEDGSISINAEDTAIGFGWTQVKNGKTYPKWERLNGYLKELGFSPQVGKGDYIPESLFYLLGMKANNETALQYQKWLAMEVIPSLRKTGSYSMQTVDINKALAEFKGQIIGLVDEQIGNAVKQVEKKCSEYYKPSCADKSSISHYIKKRLGITKADEEYELVKERVLIKLGASKWEDVDVETLRNSMDIIDESIRVLKMERPYEQTSLFDKKGA